MGNRAALVKAYTDGHTAGSEGAEPTACPHPRDSLLRSQWIRGYARGRRERDRAARAAE